MRRSVLVLLIVALLSALICRAEHVAGATARPSDWVRTANGWERREALTAERTPSSLAVHPGLIAALQLGASLFVLLAFPGNAVPGAAQAQIWPRKPARDRRLAAAPRR